MSLRRATGADLEAIMALERESFPTDAWSDAMMREELASPHGRYLVLEDDGRLIGYGGVRAARGAPDADIQTIALASRARGRGRGRELLRALLAEAAELDAREVFLDVRADNPVAQALYLSEGFVEIARRPRYYRPEGVDAVVMKLDLRDWAAAGGRASEIVPTSETVPTSDRIPPGAPTPAGSPTPDGSSSPAAPGPAIPGPAPDGSCPGGSPTPDPAPAPDEPGARA